MFFVQPVVASDIEFPMLHKQENLWGAAKTTSTFARSPSFLSVGDLLCMLSITAGHWFLFLSRDWRGVVSPYLFSLRRLSVTEVNTCDV